MAGRVDSLLLMTPISVFSPWCGTSALRSPLPSASIGVTIEAMPFETSRTRLKLTPMTAAARIIKADV